MTQPKHSQENLNSISIYFANKKFEIKAEIIQFSSFLLAAHEHNAHAAQWLKETGHQLKTTQEIHIDELLAAIQPISFDEVYIVFHLLDTIYNGFTPRTDGGYIAQQIQPLFDYVLVNKSNLLVSNICLIADALDIPLLLNACVGAIFAKPPVVSIITEVENIDFYQAASAESIAHILFNMDFKLFSEPRILKLLKKHYFLKKNNLQELSVADYLWAYAQPPIEDGGLISLSRKKLTNLYGIDQLSNKENITCLFLANNFLQACIETEETVSFVSFTNLVALNLSDNHLTNLPKHFFKNLASLAVLSLGRNQLTTLDPVIFQELTHLKSLWLNNNHIKTLPAEIFKNLTSLETLNLESNCLDTLEATTFQNLTHLQKLDLRDNKLIDPNLTIFSGLTALTELLLGGYNQSCNEIGCCE